MDCETFFKQLLSNYFNVSIILFTIYLNPFCVDSQKENVSEESELCRRSTQEKLVKINVPLPDLNHQQIDTGATHLLILADISGSMSGNPITQVYRLAFPYNLVSVQPVPFCTRHQNDIQYIKGYLYDIYMMTIKQNIPMSAL